MCFFFLSVMSAKSLQKFIRLTVFYDSQYLGTNKFTNLQNNYISFLQVASNPDSHVFVSLTSLTRIVFCISFFLFILFATFMFLLFSFFLLSFFFCIISLHFFSSFLPLVPYFIIFAFFFYPLIPLSFPNNFYTIRASLCSFYSFSLTQLLIPSHSLRLACSLFNSLSFSLSLLQIFLFLFFSLFVCFTLSPSFFLFFSLVASLTLIFSI